MRIRDLIDEAVRINTLLSRQEPTGIDRRLSLLLGGMHDDQGITNFGGVGSSGTSSKKKKSDRATTDADQTSNDIASETSPPCTRVGGFLSIIHCSRAAMIRHLCDDFGQNRAVLDPSTDERPNG